MQVDLFRGRSEDQGGAASAPAVAHPVQSDRPAIMPSGVHFDAATPVALQVEVFQGQPGAPARQDHQVVHPLLPVEAEPFQCSPAMSVSWD